VASIFSAFTRPGRLPAPLRAKLEPEDIIHVAERVRVAHRFSGSVPGLVSGWSAHRHLGLVVLTGMRVFALLPSVPRLDGPAVDVEWAAPDSGAAKVTISDAGLRLALAVGDVDPRFRGDLSLQFAMPLADDVLEALPRRSLAFDVDAAYVFHMLGVRVR
jgi:hypothetical protein